MARTTSDRECKCLRCGHQWTKKITTRPVQCPACKQSRWDTPARTLPPLTRKAVSNNGGDNPRFDRHGMLTVGFPRDGRGGAYGEDALSKHLSTDSDRFLRLIVQKF